MIGSCRSRLLSRTVILNEPSFTRFIPPERPKQVPGMWQRYYTRWRVATRECLDLRLLELMPPLAALCNLFSAMGFDLGAIHAADQQARAITSHLARQTDDWLHAATQITSTDVENDFKTWKE